MNDDDKYLRDLFAGFAMNGLINCSGGNFDMDAVAESSYKQADAMMETRNKEKDYAEKGITAIKKRTATRKMD
jgi:hypothetical protein